MPTPSKTEDGRVMSKNRCANSSTRPRAPRRCKIGSRNTSVAPESTMEMSPVISRLEVASARASAMRCAPTARDTTAVMPISMPMYSDR